VELSVEPTAGLRPLYLLPHMTHLTRPERFITRLLCSNTDVSAQMTSPTPKGKEKEKEADAPETELTEAQRLKRSFERSLAGPSVGKAGLIRDQTGRSGFWRRC
jgi:hypothetical protein